MKKLLYLVLITLILGLIISSIEDEWDNESKCKENNYKCYQDLKTFLKKYGIYDDLIILFTKNLKTPAKLLCMKIFNKEELCTDIINITWILFEKYLYINY